MRTVWWPVPVLIVGLLPTAFLHAETPRERKAAEPALVLRLAPINHVIDDAKYLAELLGQGEQAKQFDGFVRAFLGKKAFETIDAKRPIALYAIATPDLVSSPVVLVVPTGNEKDVLDLLDRFNVKPEKGADGVYTVEAQGGLPDVYFRFAHQHAYITVRDKSFIAKTALIAPGKLHPNQSDGSLVSVNLRLDQLPDDFKQLALGQIELRLADLKEKRESDTAAQAKLRGIMADVVSSQIKSLLTDGGSVGLALVLDRQTGNVTTRLTLGAKDGSQLARDLKAIGQTNSLMAAMLTPKAAANVGLTVQLPEAIRKAAEPVIDELIEKAVKKESDPGKRQRGEKTLRALAPTLKSGLLDGAIHLRGPNADGKLSMLMGLRIVDGKQIEAAVKELIDALPEAEKKTIAMNADQVGEIAIHKLDRPDGLDEKWQQMFGTSSVYVAIGKEHLVFAAGPEGLSVLKAGLADTSPKAASPLRLDMAVSRILSHLGDNAAANRKILEEVFGKDAKGADVMALRLEGGQQLTLDFQFKAALLKYAAKAGEKQKTTPPSSGE